MQSPIHVTNAGVRPMSKPNVGYEMQIDIIMGRQDTLQVSASPGR